MYGTNEEKIEWQKYKKSLSEIGEGRSAIGDLMVGLPPLDFVDPEGENFIDDHKHALYSLKPDHIQETVQQLIRYAEINDIPLIGKQATREFVKRWLTGEPPLEDMDHDISEPVEILKPTNKNINWFTEKIMNSV
jgi:hypothetical protein